MTGLATHNSPELHAARDDARRMFDSGGVMQTPASLLWPPIERLLQLQLQRPLLSGRAVIAEARQAELLTLADAHVLVALADWAGQTTTPARTEEERTLVREARLVVAHVASVGTTADHAGPSRNVAADAASFGRDPTSQPTSSSRGVPASRATRGRQVATWIRRERLLLTICLLLIAALLMVAWRGRQRERAMQRTMTAASRELGVAMVEAGRPDVGRRILVRTLATSPDDTLAQGYLACALWRLQRVEEARRWAQRAGRGSWERCWMTPIPLGGPPTGGTIAPYPSSIP